MIYACLQRWASPFNETNAVCVCFQPRLQCAGWCNAHFALYSAPQATQFIVPYEFVGLIVLLYLSVNFSSLSVPPPFSENTGFCADTMFPSSGHGLPLLLTVIYFLVSVALSLPSD